MSSQDTETIAANLLSSELKLKEHMRDLSNKLGLFMVSVSVGVYQLDSFLGFHMDLLALCDGEISVLRGDTTLHYIVSHWGCSLLKAAT